MPKLRWNRRYATLAAAIAFIELAIACFARDEFVRPYLGDTLAVILLYAAVLAVLELPRARVAVLAFAFACALELGQALQLWALLGLAPDAPLTVILGTFYDPRDLIAYAAALPLIAAQRAFRSLIALLDSRRLTTLGARPHSTQRR